MPLLEISVNIEINDCKIFAAHASEVTAKLLDKPEQYVLVKIQSQQTLIFAGSNAPAAHVKLKSLGLPENKTADFSAALCGFISTELNIDSARIYIEFTNPERHMWGWNKRTF